MSHIWSDFMSELLFILEYTDVVILVALVLLFASFTALFIKGR